MKKICLSLLALIVWSCNEEKNFSGNLQLNRQLIVKGEKGSIQIPAGLHESRIKKSGKSLEIGARVNGKWISAQIKKASLKPDSQGNINLPAAKSGQSFDLVGRVSVQQFNTDQVTQTRSCRIGYRAGDIICSDVYIPRTCHTDVECGTNALGERICKERGEICSGGHHEQQCHTESIPVYGNVLITSYQEVKLTRLETQILEAGSRQQIGSFTGEDRESKTKYIGASCNY